LVVFAHVESSGLALIELGTPTKIIFKKSAYH